MNKVILIGRISRIPSFGKTEKGSAVLNFDIETTEKWIDRAGVKQEKKIFHSAVQYGALAQQLYENMTLGDLISLEGSLWTYAITAADGSKSYRQEIKASQVEVLTAESKMKFSDVK